LCDIDFESAEPYSGSAKPYSTLCWAFIKTVLSTQIFYIKTCKFSN
jgi:hypothetical protein